MADRLFSLTEHTVVVTGAGRGLGQAMAVAACAAGANVFGVARSRHELDETLLRAGGHFEPVVWDLSDIDSLGRLCELVVDRAGAVDGVVHSAGIQRRGPAISVRIDDWQEVLRIQLEAPFFLSTAIGQQQQRTGRRGSHVFIGSLASFIGLRDMAPYVAAKSGILGVMRALAVEWAPAGIRANAIVPGYFRTSQTAELLADPVRQEGVVSRIPMGRIGVPEDLGGACVYLLSDASQYQTGTTIHVDGGWLAS